MFRFHRELLIWSLSPMKGSYSHLKHMYFCDRLQLSHQKLESISHPLNFGWCFLFWLRECNKSDIDRAPILSLKRLALLGNLSASCVWAQANILEDERPHGEEQKYSSWQPAILANSLKTARCISKLVLDYPAPSPTSSWL